MFEIGYKLKCDDNGKFDYKKYEEMTKFCNQNNLSIADHRPEYFEIIENSAQKTEITKQIKIAELKANLSNTDYAIIKIAEGVATSEEYKNIIEQRQVWRKEINNLEGANDVNN